MVDKIKNELLKLFLHFDIEVINYAIKYTSINGSSPKQFLLKILSNWKNANITTLEQAQNFKINSKKIILFNFLKRKHLNGYIIEQMKIQLMKCQKKKKLNLKKIEKHLDNH